MILNASDPYKGYGREFELPLDIRESHLMQQIDVAICLWGTAINRWVIGPAFKPKPAELEIRDHIRHLVEIYRLEFLRPLNNYKADLAAVVRSVLPTNRFEWQVLDCLEAAVQVMVPFDPVAEEIERTRVRAQAITEARKVLFREGIATPAEANARLRSLRVAEEILGLVRWKTGMARAPYRESLAHMEEQYDARLVAITKSKAFLDRWSAFAGRLSVDEPYYTRLSLGIDSAIKRLRSTVETIHKAYDLKVSREFCKVELANACAANVAKIQAESVAGIHLSNDDVKAAFSAENWQFVEQGTYGPEMRREFTCQAGKHQLRGSVWTDFVDELVRAIDVHLVIQAIVKYPDGAEHPRMFDGRLITLLDRASLPEVLRRFPTA
jgi:hypothetical protein